MLFTSPQFLFAFLPIVLVVFFVLGALARYRLAAGWLAVSSLAFYAWDDPKRLLPLILVSIVFNYLVGTRLASTPHKGLLYLGVAINLSLLGWFKYLGFITGDLGALGVPIRPIAVTLPLGISFYTFTQIAFLVDAYRGEAKEYNFVRYVLFVSFFPHLVAGPILHHKEMMPQFGRTSSYKFHLADLSRGFSYFIVGLAKKALLADSLSALCNPMFDAAAAGQAPSLDGAWLGTISYALQIYFDFSGYSDMAIGLALMMGIELPLNFMSPYKSASLVEFWRRWHMTLSRFLRDYLYIPLGGNRHGWVARVRNLMITMLLGGLWHGASWNFVIWGGIHGMGLVLNQQWRTTAARLEIRTPPWLGHGLTLMLVALAWVPFRARDIHTSTMIWAAMMHPLVFHEPLHFDFRWIWIALSGAVLLCPNSAQIFGRAENPTRLAWTANPLVAMALGACLGASMARSIAHPAAFLYSRF